MGANDPTRRELLAGLAAPAASLLVKPRPVRSAKGRRATRVVVVGSGVFGAWTAWHLQRRGFEVTLVDAWGPGNARASSGGETRVTRAAYGPDEIYSRWARESLPEWKALAVRSGQPLFVETGMLILATADDPRIVESARTLARLDVPHAVLDRAEVARRFPQFGLDGIEAGLWEPEAGALLARRSVAALAAELEAAGVRRLTARVLPPGPVSGGLAELRTADGESLPADRFVFACGPWLDKLFPELLGRRLFVTRQEVHFFGVPAGDTRFAPSRFPVWLIGDQYGIPDIEGRGFKIANDQHGPRHDPDSAERVPSPEAIATAREFLARRFPQLAGAPLVESRVCQYENSANGDFLIDRHPQAANVVLVGCGSGHGFKHGPAVGAAAASLVAGDDARLDSRLSLATKADHQQRAVH
ncbi:MAG: FAD-dependent oxidoreductase [Thermoanaerobaculia bacterium]